MRRAPAQFTNSAVSRQARSVPRQFAEPPVIGMLVFDDGWSQNDSRTLATNDVGEFDRVRGAKLQMRVAIELDEFAACSQQCRRLLRFGGAFFRRAVTARFTP